MADTADNHIEPVLSEPSEDGTLGQQAEPGQQLEPGQQAEPGQQTEAAPYTTAEEIEELQRSLDERTADLQRLNAEYANYRRRVEREREAIATEGKASVLAELLPVLDDLERAEAHGDLTGPVKAVTDKLTKSLHAKGLEPLGQEGEPFDPSVHEAVQHQHTNSLEIVEPTVTAVLRRGYRIGDRMLRTALVAVTEPELETLEDLTLEDEPGSERQDDT